MTPAGWAPSKALIVVTAVIYLSAIACASSVQNETSIEAISADLESIGMPDLTCMDLSKAKGLLSDISQGRYSAESSDASGDDRLQLMDSNWVVVEQDPLPGEPLVDEPKVAVLKDAEASTCSDEEAVKPTPTIQAQQISSDASASEESKTKYWSCSDGQGDQQFNDRALHRPALDLLSATVVVDSTEGITATIDLAESAAKPVPNGHGHHWSVEIATEPSYVDAEHAITLMLSRDLLDGEMLEEYGLLVNDPPITVIDSGKTLTIEQDAEHVPSEILQADTLYIIVSTVGVGVSDTCGTGPGGVYDATPTRHSPTDPSTAAAEPTPTTTTPTQIERPTLPDSTATPPPAFPTNTPAQTAIPSNEPLDTIGVPVDASRLSSATVQHILLAEAGAWAHPDYRAVTAMFNAYAATLNRGEFEAATGFLSTSLRRKTRLETFANQHQMSVSPMAVESITGNGTFRQVRVRYVSTSEQPALDCKEWAVDYQLVLEAERWRIDGSETVPNSPISCSGLAPYSEQPKWYSLTVNNWANLRDAPDGETIAEIDANELLYPNGEERWGVDARWTAVRTADGRQGWMANFLLRPHFSDNANQEDPSTSSPTENSSPEATVPPQPSSADPTPLPTRPSQAQPLFAVESDNNCVEGYSPCIEPGPDVDCAGGSGNGPRYVSGPISVTGSDPYDLDRDGDGIGCE